VDHCSRSKTHLALMFAPGSKGDTHRVAPASRCDRLTSAKGLLLAPRRHGSGHDADVPQCPFLTESGSRGL
jgi:hypothetical protein